MEGVNASYVNVCQPIIDGWFAKHSRAQRPIMDTHQESFSFQICVVTYTCTKGVLTIILRLGCMGHNFPTRYFEVYCRPDPILCDQPIKKLSF
jgi:hypothetical protein